MKGFLTLLILGVAGFFGYRYYASLPPSFGVKPTRPIGQVDDIDDYMRAKGVARKEVRIEAAKDIFGLRFGTRSDLEAVQFGTPQDGVIFVRSTGGQLLGVGARFKSGTPEYKVGGSGAQRFTSLYWMAVTGEPPTWVDGGGLRGASLDRGRAQCSWEKDVSVGRAATTDVVRFIMGKAMIRAHSNK